MLSLMKVVIVPLIIFFVFISDEAGATADATSCTATNNEYIIVGVSGMLLILILILIYANYFVLTLCLYFSHELIITFIYCLR
jgi:hypothetical protein